MTSTSTILPSISSKLQHYLTNARRPLFADPGSQIFSVRISDRPMLVKSERPAVIIMLTGGASPLYATEIAKREQDCILFTSRLRIETKTAPP